MPVGVDGGEVWYYRNSMVRLSGLRFQLVPGNVAGHKGTAEPNHDAASVRLWTNGWRLWSCIVFMFFLSAKFKASTGWFASLSTLKG